MSKQIPLINEFVSLTVMLLMIVALVAGQADARLNEAKAADTSAAIALVPAQPKAPVATRIRANIELDQWIISIDATAELGRLIP